MIRGLAEGVLPAGGRVDLITEGFQIDAEGSHDPGFVVDHENPGSLSHRPAPGTRPEDEPIGLATLNSMTIVVPPPGVSSMISSVVHRFEKSTRNRQAQTDPFSIGCISQPLKWLEHDVAGCGGDARSLVADPQVDPTGHLTGADPDGLVPGDHVTAFSTRLATTRSNRSGSVWTGGSDSDMSTETRSDPWPRLDSAEETTSSSPTGRKKTCMAPA